MPSPQIPDERGDAGGGLRYSCRPHSFYDVFMALKSTIFKAELQIADMDRHYYGTHALTVARHPSETDERMMVRILAYAIHAGDALAFGKGLSTDDEPDVWQKDLTGAIELWLDVGQPDERRILKACGRSQHVVVYSYSSTGAIWWNQIAGKLERAKNLSVFQLAPADSQALARLAQRSMQLQCTIQDGQLWINGEGETLAPQLSCLKQAAIASR
jgi:uncharacterized protein YaeQ